ncbi:uncharacterized protein EI90DRAFT_380291 [Cantharellus anzutake]|uniref:uncharacterized protein n=1 Tax=Cantharellus anzutake TaxID=1750568 RepID=UPI0019065883|nr:uncharacterized protein EI90DRAFT_380291 [Cantharellus anzutake]KAF8334952.1 hypothetical protein EI90DRAFT_380291 [Cantharellus anzutake]
MGLVLALQKLPPAFAMLVSSRPEQGVILAWSKPRTKELTIPCEDVDKMEHNEDFYTVRRMVEDGLRENSSWKPTEWELDAFSRACRGLPVIASIRIRDVCRQARRGRTLQSAFKGLLSVTDTPADLNHEYLRILRQAYEVDSAGIPPDVSKMYRLVITAILTASGLRNVSSMSQMFGISEDEIYATLEPISSIINLPSENESEITFYHATAREFITGEPIGDEKDKVFFIDDVNGYLLGLPLLRHFNDCCERNVFGIPTDPISLGEQEKWDEFKAKKKDYRSRFHYVVENLFKHLDPSQLFSQESNELQNEFDSFITRNSLLTFMHLQYHTSEVWDGRIFPSKLLEFNNHDSIQLLRDLHRVNQSAEYSPWRFYRMDLPFAQPSVYKQYGHLSGVRVFSIHDKFGDTIALSEDLCRAQEVMHAKLTERVRRWGQEINYEAEFYQPDIRNGVVSCAALSPDGRYVAFGFGSGVIEVADIDHQRTICQLQHNPANLPVWVEFVHGSHRVATEDIDGNVTVLGHGMAPVKLGNLPSGLYPAETAISDNGLFIIRAPRNFDNPWYNNMTLISVSDYPFIQPLTSPSGLSIPFAPPPSNHRHGGTEFSSSRPHRRTFGFSPGARYVSAFAGFNAFIWSTRSYELIACYRVTDSFHWIINPNRVPPTHLHLVPNPVFTQASPPLAEDDTAYAHRSDDAAHDSEDKSWIKRPFYDLSPELNDYRETNAWLASSATGENPLIWSQSVMFNGRKIFDLPAKYQPVTSLLPWYGHRVPESDRPGLGLYRLQSSRNGTRFLVQGESKAPIVIDISQIV